jgi:hypothetical protein
VSALPMSLEREATSDTAVMLRGHLAVLVAYARTCDPRGADRERVARAIAHLAVRIHAFNLARPARIEATELAVPVTLSAASGYQGLVDRVRESIARVVPGGSRVAVISKGDNELLRIPTQVASHFPAGRDGGYAGFYPADGAAALAALQAAIRSGVDYLAIPETGRWWLDFYAEFAAFLRDDCRILVDDAEVGIVFELSADRKVS